MSGQGDQARKLTAATHLSRRTAADLERFEQAAQQIAEMASLVAKNLPSKTNTVSGEIARLSQYVTDLLRSATKLEANFEAIELMKAEEDSK